MIILPRTYATVPKNLRIKFFRRIHKYIGVDAAYKLCVCDKIVKYKIRKIIR